MRYVFGLTRLASIAFLSALCLPIQIEASEVTVTITGVMAGGSDETGVFGPPNASLAGQNFTLVFNVDDTKGVQDQSTCPGNIPYATYIESTPLSNPATATLTINGHSFTFGLINAAYEADSEVQRYASTPTCGAGSSMYLAVGDGYYGNGSGLDGSVYPATGTILTANPNWEAPFSDSNLFVSPVDAGTLQFEISEERPVSQSANGQLIPQSIAVSGPISCISENVSLARGGFYTPTSSYIQYMLAEFTTPNSTTLPDYAASCGFVSFDWQQRIIHDPGGSNIAPNDPAPLVDSGNVTFLGGSVIPALCLTALGFNGNGCSLIAPPLYFDPPKGGYTYENDENGRFYDPYPFYYPVAPSAFFNPNGACTVISEVVDMFPVALCPWPFPYVVNSGNTTLSFEDNPADHVLSGEEPSTEPRGKYLAFSNSLVGIDVNGNGHSLFEWTWNTTFNGSAGGVDQTSSFFPTDPNSGTGGVTITSINGIQLPASVLSSQLSITASGLAYSRVTQTFNGTIELINIGSGTINGPLQAVFSGLPLNVTLVNETGNLSGTPYITVPAASGLPPGQSITLSVQFKNPSNATIDVSPAIYSGTISQ